MKGILSFLFLVLASAAMGQSVLPFRGDTIKIYKQGGSAELVLQNRTQDTTGFLYNKGHGVTEFRRVKRLNDTTIVFGSDTISVGKGSGSSSVTTKNPITTDSGRVAIKYDTATLQVLNNALSVKQPDPTEDKKVEVPYGSGLIVVGNSISIDQGALYYTYTHYLNKVIGGTYNNYAIAGSSVTNIGDMLRNNQLPFNRRQLALYNNGINDIRFKKSEAAKQLVLNATRSFLVNAFKADVVDASAMTVNAGSWTSYNALANTVVSKTNCLTTTDLNASISFTVSNDQPGIFISFLCNADTSSTNWSDSVEIYRSGTTTKIAIVNPNKKGNAPNMPFVVWLPNTDVLSPITIINRKAARLVIDYAGTTQFNNMCAPALVAEISKVADAALQPGIGQGWWDTVNTALRSMVKEEFIKYGYPVATIDVNNGLKYNDSLYMTFLSPGTYYDPPNAIHPTTKAHFDVFLPQALKKIVLTGSPKKIIEYATNTATYVSTFLLTPGSEKVIILPQITQNSEILIPKDKYYLVPGQKVTFINNNTSAFTWNTLFFTYALADGTTSTQLDNSSVTELVWTAEGFRLLNKTNTAGYINILMPGGSREKTVYFRNRTQPNDYFNYIENRLDGDPYNHYMMLGVNSNHDTTDAIRIGGDSVVTGLTYFHFKKNIGINLPTGLLGRPRDALDVNGNITLGSNTGNPGDENFFHRIRSNFVGLNPAQTNISFDVWTSANDGSKVTPLVLQGSGRSVFNYPSGYPVGTTLTLDSLDDDAVPSKKMVNNAIAGAHANLIFSAQFTGTGSTFPYDPITIDTFYNIAPLYGTTVRIDSIVTHWPTGTGGGSGQGRTVIKSNSSVGDSVFVKLNDSTYIGKKFKPGVNTYWVITDSTLQVNDTASGAGGAVVNTEAFTVATSTTRTIAADNIIEFILVKPVSDLTAFKVGTSTDDAAFVDPIDCVGGAWTTIQVNGYLDTSTVLYFAGITSSTQIKIVKKALHE